MFGKTSLRVATSTLLLALVPFGSMAKTYQHSMGSVEINDVPKRVVVLGYGSLDYVDALGITPVGVPKTLLPTTLEKYKGDSVINTGSVIEVNFETLFTLKPDLIIAEGRMANSYKDLKDIAPTYMFEIDTKDYWKTTQNHWRVLGDIFNKEERAEQLIADVQAQIEQLHTKVAANPPRALTVSNSGNNLAMFGPDSRFSFVYNEAGFATSSSDNVKAKAGKHGNLISFEYIADAQPEVLLVLDREQAIGRSNGKAKALFDNELIKSTPAEKNNRVMFIDPAAWYLTAGGYQSTQTMIKELNQVIVN
ncbi:siderophore ABC transporter substrate-binding protein [Vibrio alginolyticus]|uniref:siderophore ABC transporter substrate-binding protein n=1 Tax=Vibrio sp. B1FLJ16 TaxID=2751178 RepID=UPI0015F74B7C|nr:siderophore ABC transporter substrate-binding protein [Vibrio sp. B1FLJ16]CAD7822441.1 Periplasmic binding protein [Vibrio sp. B1FLJ16]CAE6949081.1 Periplasmic binding protein [Vibrio sp. B1FLJ16]